MKLRIIALILFSILTEIHADAQKTYLWGVPSGGIGNDFVNDITSSGTDIYVAGTFIKSFQSLKNEIDGEERTDIFLAKYDKNGNVIWLKALTGKGSNEACCISSNDENIYLAGIIDGTVNAGSQKFPGSGKALFVSCWDYKGKIQWISRVPYTGSATLDALTVNQDGSLIVGGMFQDTLKTDVKTLVSSIGKRAYLVEFTPLGKIAQAITSEGSGNHRFVAAATDEKDGSRYYLLSTTGDFNFCESPVIERQNGQGSNLILLKTNNEGNYIWTKVFNGNEYLEGLTLQVAPHQSILVGVNYNTKLTTVDTIINAEAQLEAAVFSFNKEGDFEWLTRLKSNTKSRIMDAHLYDSGNLLVAGYFRESFEVDSQIVNSDQSWDEMFILQLDETGKLAWYDIPGDDATSFCKSFTIDKQGNMILAGGFRNEIIFGGDKLCSSGGTDILIAKYENCGELDINISVDNNLCPGERVNLNVEGNFKTYFWNDEGMGTKNYAVDKPGQYYVAAYDKRGCPAYDTIDIFENNSTRFELGPNQFISIGQNVELAIGNEFQDCFWSTGETGNNIFCYYDDNSDSTSIIVTAKSPEGCTVSDSITVFFVREEKALHNNNAELQIFPNPVTDQLQWLLKAKVSGNAIVTLLGENSELLYRKEINNYFQTLNKIEVSTLAAGSYILKVEIAGQVYSETVVKQ